MKITIQISNKRIFLFVSIILSIILTLALTEISLIFCAKKKILPYNKLSNAKKYNKFRGTPSEIRYENDIPINKMGFYDVNHIIENKVNSNRIVAIGDSYVYGIVPYKYNYLNQLENLLNYNTNKYEIIKMGIPSIGVDDYYNLLIDEGLQYNPDTIMIFFFSGNDFNPPANYKLEKGKEIFEFEVYSNQKYSTIIKAKNLMQAQKIANKRYEKKHLQLIEENIEIIEKKDERFEIEKLFNYFKLLTKIESSIYNYEDSSPSFNVEDFKKIEKNKALKYRINDVSLSEKIDYVIDYFNKIDSVGKMNNAEVIFVIQPEELQVSEKLRNEITSLVDFKNDTFDFYRTNRMLTQKMDSLNLNYIDLLDSFIKKGKSTSLYKPRDTHWNIEGNKFAAERLYERLKND